MSDEGNGENGEVEEREYGYKPDFKDKKLRLEWEMWADMVIADTNSQRRNKWLLQINDEEEMKAMMDRIKSPMKYGIIVEWDEAAAMEGKGVDVTDEQMRDPGYLTAQMRRLPQFVEHNSSSITAAVVEAISLRAKIGLSKPLQ